ncbi:MAG: ABC transporter permease, partial [candidate division Zixibacteria bacterium]|nr:ABC transporter permease [candidate division Zixibacteria bacterium]
MLANYLKVALRNMLRHKSYSCINIAGLAVGMAIFILVALYVQFEFSFDRFNKNFDRICRVELNYDGQGRLVAMNHNPIGPTLVADFPELENSVRILGMEANSLLASAGDRKFSEPGGWWTENSFFEIFSYRLLAGDPVTALVEPFSIVLSEELAEKYYPDENPLGKTMRLNDQYDCIVTGVVEDCPANSHLRYGFLVSLSSYGTIQGPDYLNNWAVISPYTYVLLRPDFSLDELNEKVRLVIGHYNEVPNYNAYAYLKPLSQIHLHSNILGEMGPRGDMATIYLYATIGLLILLIACINFMNLSTARSSRRAREVGIRKAAGAGRYGLMVQFLGESLALSVVAFIVAIVLAELLLPEFNSIVRRELTLDLVSNYRLSLSLVLVVLVVGVLSGSYPAFLMASFQPVSVLKGSWGLGTRNLLARRVLVTFQFVVSVALIIGCLTVYRQVHFMKTKDLGYNKDHIVVTEFINSDSTTAARYEALKADLLQYPEIKSISISRFTPTFNGASAYADWEGADEGQMVYINMNYVDRDYFATYGVDLVKGTSFLSESAEDSLMPCIINEAAERECGWESGLGKRIGGGRVIGVVKDFHFASPRRTIGALLLFPFDGTSPSVLRRSIPMSIKIAPDDVEKTLGVIKDNFKARFPEKIFDFRFFDEDFELLFRSEDRQAKVAGYFAILAIFISCLGLFGLASYVAEQKVREIGVRKALGATVRSITILLSKEFTKWVIIANIVAWPVAWYAMSQWLQDFDYRITIGWSGFVLAALIALVIAWV